MVHLGVAFGGDSIKRSRILSESPRVNIQKLYLGGFVYNVNYNGVYSKNIIITNYNLEKTYIHSKHLIIENFNLTTIG